MHTMVLFEYTNRAHIFNPTIRFLYSGQILFVHAIYGSSFPFLFSTTLSVLKVYSISAILPIACFAYHNGCEQYM